MKLFLKFFPKEFFPKFLYIFVISIPPFQSSPVTFSTPKNDYGPNILQSKLSFPLSILFIFFACIYSCLLLAILFPPFSIYSTLSNNFPPIQHPFLGQFGPSLFQFYVCLGLSNNNPEYMEN
jgi:hypothetical protein